MRGNQHERADEDEADEPRDPHHPRLARCREAAAPAQLPEQPGEPQGNRDAAGEGQREARHRPSPDPRIEHSREVREHGAGVERRRADPSVVARVEGGCLPARPQRRDRGFAWPRRSSRASPTTRPPPTSRRPVASRVPHRSGRRPAPARPPWPARWAAPLRTRPPAGRSDSGPVARFGVGPGRILGRAARPCLVLRSVLARVCVLARVQRPVRAGRRAVPAAAGPVGVERLVDGLVVTGGAERGLARAAPFLPLRSSGPGERAAGGCPAARSCRRRPAASRCDGDAPRMHDGSRPRASRPPATASAARRIRAVHRVRRRRVARRLPGSRGSAQVFAGRRNRGGPAWRAADTPA